MNNHNIFYVEIQILTLYANLSSDVLYICFFGKIDSIYLFILFIHLFIYLFKAKRAFWHKLHILNGLRSFWHTP